MTTGWGSLLVVAVVSATVAVTVVSLVAFALATLPRRSRTPPGGAAASAGLVVALLCLAGALLVVGYGLYVVAA